MRAQAGLFLATDDLPNSLVPDLRYRRPMAYQRCSGALSNSASVRRCKAPISAILPAAPGTPAQQRLLPEPLSTARERVRLKLDLDFRSPM